MDYLSVLNATFQIHSLLLISVAVSTVFIFALAALFVISFLLSGAQVAYFSLTLKDINILKIRTQPSYRRIVNLLESPKNLFTVILIANMLVDVAIILFANLLLDEWVQQLTLPAAPVIPLKIAIITLAIVIFTEILPKIWASYHKVWFASTSSAVVEFSSLLFSKISKGVVYFSNWTESIFASHRQAYEKDPQVEIDLLDEQDASSEQKRILKGILQFGNKIVKQTMRTRLDVAGIEVTCTYDQVLTKVADMIYSRIPVYNGNLDEILGILHTKDLLPHLKESPDFDWQSLLRPVYFVHEQKLIEDLLQDFKTRRIHMAVVVDEFGGTSGIITLEDVIEEIVGDIQDEFDKEENKNYPEGPNTYIFEGKTMIDDACKLMHLPINTFDNISGDSDSVAGLVLEIAGEFPQENTELKAAGFIFTPLQITKNRILKIRIKVPDTIKNED